MSRRITAHRVREAALSDELWGSTSPYMDVRRLGRKWTRAGDPVSIPIDGYRTFLLLVAEALEDE